MSDSRTDVPVLNAAKAPDSEFYVMECTIAVQSRDTVGDALSERRVDFAGYMSKEVLESALEIMREVLV